MSKRNLWVECEEHKKYVKFLNNELLKNREFKGQPQDVKLHEEIRTLKTTLSKFVNETYNLNELLGYCRSSLNKSGNEYDGKVYAHDKNTIVCYFYGKTRHMTSICRDHPNKGSPNPFMANTKRPKKIWVPKIKVILVANVVDSKKQVPLMLLG